MTINISFRGSESSEMEDKMNTEKIKKDIEIIRKKNPEFITVANKEWYSLFKDEIRNSIAIEGVITNRNELLRVLEKNERADTEKTAAILGYFEAASSMYEYAHNQYKEQEFILRLSDIKQIHTLMMRYEKEVGTYTGDLGGFRRGDIEVAKATFKPIDAYYIRPAMQLFTKWLNEKLKEDNIDYLKLAAISHIWFETIHPFRDGNGRVGRILLSYILIGSGYVNIAIKGISKTDRNNYYDALESCDKCFEKINRKIERSKKLSVEGVDKQVDIVDFSIFEKILKSRLTQAVKRLKKTKKNSSGNEAVLSLKELSEAYDYSQDYLRNLINRKQLTAHKQGKLWYVKVRDMQDYLKRIK